MFWGLTLEPFKRYTKTVDNPFHISAAVLDTSTCDDEIVRVIVEVDDNETETIIANLSRKHGVLQSQLDLQFESGSHVAFYTQGGNSSVHLSGYIVFDIDEDMEEDDEEENESSDEETPALTVAGSAKRKIDDAGASTSKKAKVIAGASPKNSMRKLSQKIGDKLARIEDKMQVNDDDDDDDDDDDEEEDEDEDDEDEDEDEEEVEDEEDEDEDEDNDKDNEDEDVEEEEEEEEVIKNVSTPKMTENLSKQKILSKDSNVGEPNSVEVKTPKAEGKKIKKAKTPKQEVKMPDKQKGKLGILEKTPVKQETEAQKNKTAKDVNAMNGKSPKQEKKSVTNADKLKNSPVTPLVGKKSPKVVKPGGVTCEDLVVGTGPEAKRGNMISVYYEGRLMSNKKIFDKNDSGKGFKFRLGMGEVINGWDVGVIGMKVGGKRRIICPPHMAYGKKGSPPDIPPQSTLLFVIELKSIN